MSSTYGDSEYDWTERRPDKPLVVKCNYDGVNKRITFSSSRTCTFELLKHRVEQCFALSATSYAISYTDDDGETTDITTEGDLTEAIRYFHPGADDPPISSAASILSGRSFGRGKITLRVKISVEYDGPSLSDTSSLASLEEYKDRNGSAYSLSFNSSTSGEVDDDSVTVSSKDMGSKHDVFRARGPRTVVSKADDDAATVSSADIGSKYNVLGSKGSKTITSGPSREHLIRKLPQPPDSDWDRITASSSLQNATVGNHATSSMGMGTLEVVEEHLLDPSRYPEDPSAVFERLKHQETLNGGSPTSNYGPSPLQTERGAAWLRDQNARTIKTMLGNLPEPSESDGLSISEPEEEVSSTGLEFALHKNPRGRFYYAYTGGNSSAARSSCDSGYDDSSIIYDADGSAADSGDIDPRRPTSMELSWIQSQAIPSGSHSEPIPQPSSSSSGPHVHRSQSEPLILQEYISTDIPPELLPFITSAPLAPPAHPTDCSSCGALLETIRYVCSTCGEKKPKTQSQTNGFNLSILGKGKGKEMVSDSESVHFLYPPKPPHSISSSPSTSSWTLVADDNPFHDSNAIKLDRPLPPIPPLPPRPPMHSPAIAISPSTSSTYLSSVDTSHNGSGGEGGYELCYNCIESVGVIHALESFFAPGSSPGDMAPSQWRRTAPRKGQLRHAYLEKVWGPRGWDDVQQDDVHAPKCSTCNTTIVNKRYKCASCQNFNLCRACYSQVHEVHPTHTFLIVPEKPTRARSEPVVDIPPLAPMNTGGEMSMTHPGVKCAHCLLDIVGARFHCAVCDAVDICANCESAGLPGNLDSADGGHSSSHIMIKIPYPLPNDELQLASRKVKQLWDRDAPNVEGAPRSRRDSLLSSYARTVMGPCTSMETVSPVRGPDDHGIRCDNCAMPITGIRYQCASCPTKPKAYNLCSKCEECSYIVHDPKHIFFKLPRPVDTPLEYERPLLPDNLYRVPAGPAGGVYNSHNPKEYLQYLLHLSAVCDLCMLRITGEWFRCVYCAKDFCDNCESVDTHNHSHFFMVFKSLVDMHVFRSFAQLDSGRSDGGPSVSSPPVVNYPVYQS